MTQAFNRIVPVMDDAIKRYAGGGLAMLIVAAVQPERPGLKVDDTVIWVDCHSENPQHQEFTGHTNQCRALDIHVKDVRGIGSEGTDTCVITLDENGSHRILQSILLKSLHDRYLVPNGREVA